MSAWQVYWVMQLDSIGAGLFLFGLILILLGFGIMWIHDTDEVMPIRTMFFCIAAGAFLWVVDVFVPNTKTAAAMIVLPALTSESAASAVAPEARELYDLAKDALRHAAGKDEKKHD